MKFLDRVAMNRLIAIITSFILGLLKLIVPKNKLNDIVPPDPLQNKPVRRTIKNIIDKIT
jgi:hypothetical protein